MVFLAFLVCCFCGFEGMGEGEEVGGRGGEGETDRESGRWLGWSVRGFGCGWGGSWWYVCLSNI